MNPQQIKNLVGRIHAFHTKKIKLISPDFIFLIYFLVSLLCRLILNPILLEFFDQTSTFLISFGSALLVNIIFIALSYYLKIDWNGKVTNSFISKIVHIFPKKARTFLLYPLFFIFEPFLFFVYYKNGNKKRIFSAWILLILSLAMGSLIWMKFGAQSNSIFK